MVDVNVENARHGRLEIRKGQCGMEVWLDGHLVESVIRCDVEKSNREPARITIELYDWESVG